jgi:pimeloyl-ACP methyl ester carboxylesterase
MSEKNVVFDDGAATCVETWGDRGPVIVCVHGMTSSRKSWVRLADRLKHRFQVVAYDQRGHGDSAQVRGPMTLSRHVADLQSVLEAVGSDVAALVGHSWGGAVVVLAGRDAPVHGVVAIDPMLCVAPGTWRREYLGDTEELLAKPWAAREQSVRAATAGWGPQDTEGKLHAVRHMTAEPIARLGSENSVDSGGWDIRSSADAYPKPLLIFAARPDDSVMSLSDVAHVKKNGGANVRVAEFASEGHNLHRTAFDAFATEAEEFLLSLPIL